MSAYLDRFYAAFRKPPQQQVDPIKARLSEEIGISPELWDIYRDSVAQIESKGRYDIFGGSGNHYDGRYQMGKAAKKDAARYLGIDDPGHSTKAREAFRNNPELQEQLFAGFTLANHNYLMKNKKYAEASPEEKLQILGYAHNQGMGGASKWLDTGEIGKDAFGTAGTKYSELIAKNQQNFHKLAASKPDNMSMDEYIRF